MTHDSEGNLAQGKADDFFNLPQPRFCMYGIQIKLISCGDEHSAFVTSNSFIYTMGSNRSGQLGIRDPAVQSKSTPVLVEQMVGHVIVDLSCGGSHTLVATERGDAYSWGEGRYGALGIPDTLTDQHRPQRVIFQDNSNSHKRTLQVTRLSAGKTHSAFINQEG